MSDTLRGTISGIDFGLLTSEDVDNYSVIDLTDAPVKKKNFDGVCSKRLGAGDANCLCSSCAKNIDGCRGHMGKFELYQPVINVLFLPLVPRILSCICIRCSRLLLPDHHLSRFKSIYSGNYRRKITELYALTARNRICWFDDKNPKSKPRLLSLKKSIKKGYCGTRQPDVWSIMKDEKMIIRPAFYIEEESDFQLLPTITPKQLYEVLRGVSERDHLLFGFDPKKSPLHAMFFSSFPVAPMTIRQSRNGTSEDDLTKRLRQVQKANQVAKKNIVPNLTLGLLREPNYNRQTLLTNVAIKKLPKIQGPMSTKHTRKKQGVIPECLNSYFVLQRQAAGYIDSNFHSNLDKDFGRETLGVKQRYIASATDAGRVRGDLNGKRVDLSGRSVISGDTYQEIDEIGLPQKMMMELAYGEMCCAYNFHSLQQTMMNGEHKYPGCNYIERKGEYFFPDACEEGLQFGDKVHRHMINGDPIIVNRQPTLHKYSMMVHKARLSKDVTIKPHLSVTYPYGADFDGDEMNVHLPSDPQSRAEAVELMSVSKNMVKDGRLMIVFVQHAVIGAFVLTSTTEEIFSKSDVFQLLMQGIHDDLIDEAMDKLDSSKTKYNGQDIMASVLPTYTTKTVLDKKSLNLCMLQLIQNEPKKTDLHIKRMGFIVRILETYCKQYGVSIGYDDYLVKPDPEVEKIAKELEKKANDLSIKNNINGCKKRDLDDEYAIITFLSRARDQLGIHAMNHLKSKSNVKKNGFLNTVISGSKGNATHITQSTVGVGLQVNDLSQRNSFKMNYYFADDISAYGYISRSFASGLRALEFYLHLFSSRLALIGAAVQTSVTGYLYRKISKFVEDLQTYWDGSIRNANGQIIMFHYGFDTSLLANFFFQITKLNIKELIDIYHIQDPIDKEDMSSLDEISRLLILRYRALFYITNCIPLPVDMNVLSRLLKMEPEESNPIHIPYKKVREAIGELWIRLVVDHHISNTELYEAAFFDIFSTKNLLFWGCLKSVKTFKFTLDFIANRYTSQLCQMGAPKGLDCAQGLSEPGTQANLKRFHISGEQTKLVDGVQRLGEIINLVKNIATPSMDIFIEKDHESTFDPLNSLVELYIDSIVVNIYDKPPINSTIKPTIDDVVLTLNLNREQMIARRLPPRIVKERLLNRSKTLLKDKSGVMIYYSDLKEESWWLTIVINKDSKIINAFSKSTEPIPLLSLQLYHVLRYEKTILAGIVGIKDYHKCKKKIWVYDELNDNKLIQEERCVYETKGSNLAHVCLLPGVDIEYTTTNDIHQINQFLGIDAAMHAIESQLYATMVELEATISSRHVTLIANTMCASGVLTPLTFAGMNSSKHCASYLKLSTFERSLNSFLGAGISGHVDHLKGVSESIVAGTKMNLGTGSNFELITDNTLIPKCHRDNLSILLNNAKKIPTNPPDISKLLEKTEELLVFKLTQKPDLMQSFGKRKLVTNQIQWGGFDFSQAPSSPRKMKAKKQKKLQWGIAI